MLALTIWTTLTNCLKAMTGAEIRVITHGQKLSSLFARASSNALALQGPAKTLVGTAAAGEEAVDSSSDGDSVGDEKDSR